MLRFISFLLLILMQLLAVSCNSQWTDNTVKNTVDLPEFQLNENNLAIAQNLSPGTIITSIQVNEQKCNSYDFNLADTINGFFQIDTQGVVSLVSAYPPAGLHSIQVIAECNFERFTFLINLTVEQSFQLEVDFITDFPKPITTANTQNYIVSGTCSGLDGSIQVLIGSVLVNTPCIDRNWSVSRDLSTLPEGNTNINVTYSRSNSSSTATISHIVTKDTVSSPPVIIQPVDNQKVNTTSVNVSGICEAQNIIFISGDIQSPVQLSCPAIGSFASTVELTTVDGLKSIEIKQTDVLGNISDTATTIISVDRVRPIPTLSMLSSDEGIVTLKVKFADMSPMENPPIAQSFNQDNISFNSNFIYDDIGDFYTVNISLTVPESGPGMLILNENQIADSHGNRNLESQLFTLQPAPKATLFASVSGSEISDRDIIFDLYFSESVVGVSLADFSFNNIAPLTSSFQTVTPGEHYRFSASVVGSGDLPVSVQYLANQAVGINSSRGNFRSEIFEIIYIDPSPRVTISMFPADQIVDWDVTYEMLISEDFTGPVIDSSHFEISFGSITNIIQDPSNPRRYTFNAGFNAVYAGESRDINIYFKEDILQDYDLNNNLRSNIAVLSYKATSYITFRISSGASTEIELPLVGDYEIKIDWDPSDDSSPIQSASSSDISPSLSLRHTFPAGGFVHAVQISGQFEQWQLDQANTRHNIFRESLHSFVLGDHGVQKLSSAFKNCAKLRGFYNPVYTEAVVDISSMFEGAGTGIGLTESTNWQLHDFNYNNIVDGGLVDIFKNSGIGNNNSQYSYDKFLEGLANNGINAYPHNIGPIPSSYSASALSDLDILNARGWSFDDQGQAP